MTSFLLKPIRAFLRPWLRPTVTVNPVIHLNYPSYEIEDDYADNTVRIKRLSETAVIPGYQTEGAAGMDLHADIPAPIALYKGQTMMIPTGIAIALPSHLEAQVRSRSGLAAKSGVHVLNSPGTIDSDYRGEIKVILKNAGDNWVTIKPGDRVAQLVIAPVIQATLEEVEELDETKRGEGGFGSTGVATEAAAA